MRFPFALTIIAADPKKADDLWNNCIQTAKVSGIAVQPRRLLLLAYVTCHRVRFWLFVLLPPMSENQILKHHFPKLVLHYQFPKLVVSWSWRHVSYHVASIWQMFQ